MCERKLPACADHIPPNERESLDGFLCEISAFFASLR